MNRALAVQQRAGRWAGWRTALAAAAVLAASTAHATSYSETGMGDLSNLSASPTLLGPLTPGSNHIVGSTIPSGPVIDPTGALAVEDNDYVNFVVPVGYALIAIDSILTQPTIPIPGSPSVPGDRAFVGIARGVGVFLTGVNGPATGLLGWTLPGVSAPASIQDILPALGASAPADFPIDMFTGATRFVGSLGAGSYTLWLLDGDSPAFYDLNLVVAAVPEPSIWLLLALGISGVVAQRLRRSPGRVEGARSGRSPLPC